MLDITRMLTDKKFRKKVVGRVNDIVVKNFWEIEFGNWDARFRNEAIAPVLNKIGAFISNPMIRNIIGQPKGSFNIREIMDEGKILILNLSRGLIGEHNAGILGAMMVTKIQLAAMSRADIADISNRRPFYLYVDEFQNFATDSFAVILSEARKYGLCLTLANQYISQMPEEVMGAVFGNVGSLITFRASANDGPFLEQYFNPNFETSDIIQLANRNFIATLTINGEKADAFSGRTIDIPDSNHNLIDEITNHSRANYASPKAEVEEMIRAISTPQHQQNQQLSKNKVLQKMKKDFKENQPADPNQSNKKQPSGTTEKQASRQDKPTAEASKKSNNQSQPQTNQKQAPPKNKSTKPPQPKNQDGKKQPSTTKKSNNNPKPTKSKKASPSPPKSPQLKSKPAKSQQNLPKNNSKPAPTEPKDTSPAVDDTELIRVNDNLKIENQMPVVIQPPVIRDNDLKKIDSPARTKKVNQGQSPNGAINDQQNSVDSVDNNSLEAIDVDSQTETVVEPQLDNQGNPQSLDQPDLANQQPPQLNGNLNQTHQVIQSQTPQNNLQQADRQADYQEINIEQKN